MGRQRQGGARRKQTTREDDTLREALDATRQHTLPVLPAETFAADTPDTLDTLDTLDTPATAQLPGATSRQSARPASRTPRRTLGDATAVRARIAPTPNVPTPQKQRDSSAAASGSYALPDLETAALPPIPMPRDLGEPPLAASPVADLLAPSPARPPAGFSTGRPSLSLPALADAQLPVPIEPAERSVAPRAAAGASSALLIKGSGRTRHPAVGIVPRRLGPRSFMAQFFGGMVAVMLLVSVLTLASPLGHATVFAGAFQGYANAVPWVPTPTATPRPTATPVPYVPPPGANPGQQAIINDIVAVFGPYSQGAINVARCESGFDPNARNPYAIGNSHAEGVFQILYPSTWNTTSYAGDSPYAYDANIHAAHELFSRDGNSWREWACQP